MPWKGGGKKGTKLSLHCCIIFYMQWTYIYILIQYGLSMFLIYRSTHALRYRIPAEVICWQKRDGWLLLYWRIYVFSLWEVPSLTAGPSDWTKPMFMYHTCSSIFAPGAKLVAMAIRAIIFSAVLGISSWYADLCSCPLRLARPTCTSAYRQHYTTNSRNDIVLIIIYRLRYCCMTDERKMRG